MPLQVRNVDGSTNKNGPIYHTTIQNIHISNSTNHFHQECSEFYVTSIGTHDIILGMDWLKAHNPELNWSSSCLTFTCCPLSCLVSTTPFSLSAPPSPSPLMVISCLLPEESVDPFALTQLGPQAFYHVYCNYKNSPLVSLHAKTTHSTDLAAKSAPKPSLGHIPPHFSQYSKVFSELASHHLLQHQPWDHAINLIPDASLCKKGIYKLLEPEKIALHEYVHNHLAKGYIPPSNSPFTSPIFFIHKKDGKLHPIQHYTNLNNITLKNTFLLPLILDLIDKLQSSHYFMKFDVHWGYNNICIKHGDEWKATFKCHLGLFEPLIMTFSLCNALATFQSFMTHIFQDLIDQGHLIIYLDDILLFYHDLATLNELTHEVLHRLIKFDLYLKPEKCFFNQSSIEYLGVIISHGQVKMDPAKVQAITDWPIPCNLKETQ